MSIILTDQCCRITGELPSLKAGSTLTTCTFLGYVEKTFSAENHMVCSKKMAIGNVNKMFFFFFEIRLFKYVNKDIHLQICKCFVLFISTNLSRSYLMFTKYLFILFCRRKEFFYNRKKINRKLLFLFYQRECFQLATNIQEKYIHYEF